MCMENVNYAFEGLQSSRLCLLIEVYIWKIWHQGHKDNRSSTNHMSDTSTMHIRTVISHLDLGWGIEGRGLSGGLSGFLGLLYPTLEALPWLVTMGVDKGSCIPMVLLIAWLTGANYACVTSTTHLRDCKVAVYVCWLKFIFEKEGTEGTKTIDRQLIVWVQRQLCI